MRAPVIAGIGMALLLGVGGAPSLGAQEEDVLAVRSDGEWVDLWSAGAYPARWPSARSVVEGQVGWSPAAEGVELGELTVRRRGEPWRVRLVLVRLDPRFVDLGLVVPPRQDGGFAGRWEVGEAAVSAVFAVNAGHFTAGPWGWLVQGGELRQPPGRGRLAPGVAVHADGRVSIVPPDSLLLVEDVREGFQSYPALLEGNGEVPPELRSEGLGVDLRHRDGRLALGVLRDGRILFALTRMEGLAGLLEVAPFGPTTPEMAALMGALGCERAVLLDGGLSGQMMVGAGGERIRWKGLRKVAAGLVGWTRGQEAGGG